MREEGNDRKKERKEEIYEGVRERERVRGGQEEREEGSG